MDMIGRVKRLPLYLRKRKNDKIKFHKDIQEYISLSGDDEIFPYNKENEWPIISEYRATAGYLDEHYFLQDIWMAKKIITQKVETHFDIGSRVDGFIAHLLSAGVKVNMIDIRPLGIDVDGILFTKGDATDLRNIKDNSIPSLSSLHVVEHFGLGRYGDTVDPKGWIKGLKAMQRIVQPGGYFYLSYPVGRENKLCFNAHRVFEIHKAPEVLDQMELVEAAYIKNYVVTEIPINIFSHFTLNEDYACGMYIFRKKYNIHNYPLLK